MVSAVATRIMITTIQDLIAYIAEYHKPLKRSPALDPATVPKELPKPLKELPFRGCL
jgi:hypothetical protein